MLHSLETVDQLLAGLQYREDLFDFATLEAALSIVPAEGKAPPDIYLSLDGGQSHLPLTKIAAAKFGSLSGVKPSIYKEFARNGSLTASMVHHSMNQPDRAGKIYVASTREAVLGFYPADKPHVGLMDAWHYLKSIVNGEHGSVYAAKNGAYEISVVMNDPTDSVRPGVVLCHDGRTKVAVFTTLHDYSAVCSTFKVSKRRKTKDGCDRALEELVGIRVNEAIGESDFIYSLVNTRVVDPVRFISRLSLMNGFSAQAAEKVVSGVPEALEPNATLYDVVRYVAGFATRDGVMVDRRYQTFAHYVGFRGSSLCATCALPN